MQKTFKVKLVPMGEGGSWTCLKVPFKVEKVWRTRARLSVRGTINGFTYRSSVFPLGDGTHMMMVNKAMQAGAGVRVGQTVRVVMEPDTAPRTVRVPSELKKALAKQKTAKAVFEKLSYSHKKVYVEFITEAKRLETRAARVEKTLKALAEWRRAKRMAEEVG